jgi:hypothetical protein
MPQWSLMFWVAVLVVGVIGSVMGVLISNFLPGWRARERFTWYPKSGATVGALLSVLPAVSFLPDARSFISLPLTFLTGLIVSYLSSRLPRINQFLEKPPAPPAEPPAKVNPNAMLFRKEWNVRPRYEDEEPGLFVGRNDFLDRLNSHFISRGGGTILISGVRGVGKTALVESALVTSRQKMQNRYWKNTWKYLERARPWHVIDLKARRTLLELEGHASPDTADYLTLKRAAETYALSTPRWWQKFDPVDRRIRQMHEASRWQLLVLKFSASDISGALPEPDQRVVGRPRIDPEKLMRSIIRKLFMTFDPSRGEDEARVLQWSLRNKATRQLFFETLNAAYKKSISKSYKEIISNTINDLLKQTQSSTWEGKISWEKVGLVLACVAVGVVFSRYADPLRAWYSLEKLIGYGVPGAITGYILLSWGWKRTREKTLDQAQQSSFSYEYDYSLHQMRQDLESLVRILSPLSDEKPEFHDPFRCFRRTIVIFDELDKLENADQQLDDVITHFKNFFTLSEAVFVFITDHEFYEHLTRETVKAQLARHYPPQHTFFNEKIYLRKPEFARFREAFFRFTENAWLEQQARLDPPDPMLIHDLLKRDDKKIDKVELIKAVPLATLTQLYVQRRQYKDEEQAIIQEFEKQGGRKKAMAVAQIWASEAARVSGTGVFQDIRQEFHKVGGWKDADAVSFLYHRREDFGATDQNTIIKSFGRLETNFVSQYEGVDDAPFTLSDLARALCFQTRNHYFDLYNAVYDYVASYEDGAPVLVLEQGRYTHETKLWSRYQQLLEIAFDSARENHPSREYFNALLMESLYRAFDKRHLGGNVKVAEILFPPRDELAAVAKTLLDPVKSETVVVTPRVESEGDNFPQALARLVKLASDKLGTPQSAPAQNGGKVHVQPYTDIDGEKINKAIVRLLRLALAHKAIRGVTTDFELRLKDNKAKPSSLGDLEFSWNDNSYSNIRSVVREEHEEDLINFWKQHGSELDAFGGEITGLWLPLALTAESERISTAIADLRTKAEVVGIGQGTISGPDAAALKANVGTRESREALWPRAILDRIRAEEDADVVEAFDKPATDSIAAQAISRKAEIEKSLGVPVRAIVRPRNTEYALYVAIGPVPPTEVVDLTAAKSLLPEKTSLVWYVTGREAPEFSTPPPAGIQVYTSPLTGAPQPRRGAVQLIQDYIRSASQQRLETIITHLQATQYKDAHLAQRAGAELLGQIASFGNVLSTLGEANFDLAVKLLKEKRDRFSTAGLADWPDLTSNWSAETASKRLADEIVQKGNFTPVYRQIIEEAVSECFSDPAKSTVEGWLKAFLAATEEPNAIWLLLVKSIIKVDMRTRMDDAQINDQSLRSAINEHFVPWLSNTIQTVFLRLSAEPVSVFSFMDAAAELERQRKSLRASPLPGTPDSPAAGTGSGSRRKRPPRMS